MKLNALIALALAAVPAASFAAEIVAANVDLNKDNEVVCRKKVDTGSLVKSTKICKTRKDWKVGSENARREMEQLMGGAPPRAN